MTSTLLQTIETDLAAGESFLVQEAEGAGLWLWNVLKAAFIALGPAEVTILQDVLTKAVTAAGTGSSIEQVETAALNTASTDEQAVLLKAGSGVVQTVIAGLKASNPSAPAAAASPAS